MALFSTIQDDFEDGVFGAQWEGSYGDMVEVDGRAKILSTDGYPALKTPATHTVIGSYVFVRAYPAPVGTSTDAVTSEMLIDDGDGTRLIIVTNTYTNQIEFRSDVGYGDGAGVAKTYDPVAHAWWRMREDSGTVYMETSPDATTWTIQRQLPTPAWVTQGNNPLIFSTHRTTGDLTSHYFELDNVNMAPSATVAPATPTDLAITPADTTAIVSWQGDGTATSYDIEYRFIESITPEPEPEPIPDQVVEPWTTVTLTGSGTGAWSQIAGKVVALSGTGSTVTFEAPPSMDNQTLQFTFGSQTTTVNIARASHGIKQADGTVKPFRFSRRNLENLKTYTASDAMIANPERGWYQYTETSWPDAGGTGFTPLNSADIVTRRTSNETINGYSVPPRSIVFRYYVMGHMRNTDTLPAAFLTALQNDLNAVRDAGVKMLIRFSYSNDGTTGSNTDGNGPYGTDTTPARTLSHVSQLKSVMNSNADVIHAVQAGFIGTWGEWYYTDNWGNKGVLTQTDWDNRARLITALLDWNINIPILLRYVGLKRRYIREGTGTGWSAPAHASQALGFHNDALQASTDNSDWGTFNTFADGMTIEGARAYLAEEVAKAVPMVGETAGVSTRSTYAATSASLAEHRWSALNPNYHPDVLASWSSTDKDEVSRKLGYRLRLVSLSLPTSGTANTGTPIELTIANDGWGNPLSKRPMQIVFDNGTRTITHTLAKDIRTLGPGTHTISESVLLPAFNGTYNVYLAMPDMNESLANRPEYSIRVANTTGWANGRNDLGTTVSITGEAVAEMTPDPNDPGTFTTNIPADTSDPGTFGSGLTPDTSDPGTFVLT